MKIIDISWPLSSKTTQYKNREILKFEPRRTFEKDGARETILTIDTHCATHIDAQSHFLKDGITVDKIALDKVVGSCMVLDLTTVQEKITRQDLLEHDHEISEGDIILLKTKNSAVSSTATFNADFVFLEISGAQYLKEKKVKAVGIDYLGIERSQQGHLTHKTLLESDIVIIEGLRLEHVKPHEYFFVCLPLYAVGLDGAPARAILIEDGIK